MYSLVPRLSPGSVELNLELVLFAGATSVVINRGKTSACTQAQVHAYIHTCLHYHWLLRDSGASKPIPLARVTRPLPILPPGSWAFCHERLEAEDDERDCIREIIGTEVFVCGVLPWILQESINLQPARIVQIHCLLRQRPPWAQQSLLPSADTL